MTISSASARGASTATSGLVRDALRILAAGDNLDDVLQRCAHAVVERLDAAFARVWVLDRRGGDLLVLRASAGMYTHLDGAHARIRVGELKIGKIAQDRTPHLTVDVPNDPLISDPEWARANDLTAFAGFPLLIGDRLVGVVATFRGRVWVDDEVEALEAVAEALAAGVDRMQSAEREREMANTLHAVGRSLVSELDLERTVQTVTDAATRLTGAMYGAFFYNVVAERGESMMLYSLSGVDQPKFRQFPLPRNTHVFGPTFAGERTVRFDDVTRETSYGNMAPHFGMPAGHPPVRSYLAVPVIARHGEVLGGLFFGHAHAGQFTAADEQLVEGLAGYAAVATMNARQYGQEHSIASILQRALLPAPPSVECAEVAVRYRPAAVGAEVGGDWYDLVPLRPAGRIAITVGDVAGHDIAAAAFMGTARSALRVFALDSAGPGHALERLDRHFDDIGPSSRMTTVVHAVYDSVTRTLTTARAGHPPVLVISPTGDTRFLDDAPNPPLGVGLIAGSPVAETSVVLEEGAVAILYTDGLVEHPGIGDVHHGLLALRVAAADLAYLSPEEICSRLLGAVVGDNDAADDIALLVLKAQPATAGPTRPATARPSAASTSFPPLRESVRRARRWLSALIEPWELDPQVSDALLLATSELSTNALLHAGTEFRVEATRFAGHVLVEVSDSDPTLPRPRIATLGDVGGRGISIVRSLSQRWGVTPYDGGKRVWFEIAAAPDT